jgi:hypothetical protein
MIVFHLPSFPSAGLFGGSKANEKKLFSAIFAPLR